VKRRVHLHSALVGLMDSYPDVHGLQMCFLVKGMMSVKMIQSAKKLFLLTTFVTRADASCRVAGQVNIAP